MSPVPGLTEKIAAHIVVSLLKASAGIVRRRFGQSDAKKALETAIAEALAEALDGQDLDDEAREHYGALLAEFFAREEAASELAQLLDPRPDQAPDLATLAHEFRMAGYDPDTMPGFDLDSFLRAFFSAFYGAVGLEDSLRAGIDHKLLGAQLQQLGIVVSEVRRAADAGERSANTLERIEVILQGLATGDAGLDRLRQIVDAARTEGFLAAYRTFEEIGSGLLKAGLDLGMDSQGALEIVSRGSEASRALPAARLESVRLLAGDLLRTVAEHSPSEAELNALEDRYRQHIIRWFESLTFQGMMRAPKPIVLPLEEVYVELRAVAEVPEAADAFSVEERRLLLEVEEKDDTKRRELMSQLDAFRRERWSRTVPERKSMAEALHQRDRRAFVILGDPGSGKTTLLHFLALVYARGPKTAARRLGVDPAEADRLPIFVPLAAFDDMLRESQREGRSLTLLEFLPRYYARRRSLPSLEPLFRRALESGRALVLLDGLDEVLDVGTRTYVAQQAGAFIGEWSSRGVRFAVSSRFVGYREAPLPGNLPMLSVLDFGTPEIETFVRRWAHAFEKWVANGTESPEMLHRAKTLEAGLLEDVRSNESVRRLAANPLMLTMLALLRRQQVKRLPHRRVQLYESYVGTLLANWVDVRSEGARERSVAILDQHQAESILIPLAFWLQKEKPSGTAGRVEIRNKLAEICLEDRGVDPEQAQRSARRDAEKEADRFLQEMRQMAGLIIERGHDAFGFLHLTFQEYFAGRALAQLGDEERWTAIRPNLHDPRWREPILLCAGRLGVVENRRAQATQLVRSILGHVDPTEQYLHRNFLLALAISCDDVNLDTTLVNELVERAAVMASGAKTHACLRELVRCLGQLVVNGMIKAEIDLAFIWNSKDAALRWVAIEELGCFSEAEPIYRSLRSQLDSDNEWVASAALGILANRCFDDDDLLWQKVLQWIADGERGVRFLAALRVLPQAVRRQDARCTVLNHFCQHSDPVVRRYAVIALKDLVSSREEVRREILRSCLDQDMHVRASAISALFNLINTDRGVLDTVIGRLTDQSLLVRCSAVHVLSAALDLEREDYEKLRLFISRQEIGEELLRALKPLLSVDLEVRSIFLRSLESIDCKVRGAACQALIEAGILKPHDLLDLLSNRNSSHCREVYLRCSMAVKSCREHEWSEFWLRKVESEDYTLRISALNALRTLLRGNSKVREAVLGRLEDCDGRVRQWAVRSLSSVLVEDEVARQAVVKRLDDQDIRVRDCAASALSLRAALSGKSCRHSAEKEPQRRGGFHHKLEAKDLGYLREVEFRVAVLLKLDDQDFRVRLRGVELTTMSPGESTFDSLQERLLPWLGLDVDTRYIPLHEFFRIQEGIARRFGKKAPESAVVRDVLLEKLGNHRWSVRLGAALALLSWPQGPPREILLQVLAALDNQRGLEAYSAQVVIASFIIDQKEFASQAITLCLEALDYGTQPWEFLPESGEVRRRAAAALGKLNPVSYEACVYEKLLSVFRNDKDVEVRDAAYGALLRLTLVRDQQNEAKL